MEQRASESTQQAYVLLRIAAEADEPAERDAAVRAIDRLLAGWSDAQPRGLASELRKRRAELGTGQAPDLEDFRERFGPSKAALADGQVELGFHFGANYEGSWSPGFWTPEERGWIERAPHARAELGNAAGWPRLELGPPIDLDEPLELALEFEQPATSGHQLIVVSVAGVNVALQHGAERVRVQVTSGGTEALHRIVDEIERSGRGSLCPFAGFVPGQKYTLSIELTKKRRKAVVRITGTDAAGKVFNAEPIHDVLVLPIQEGPGSSNVVVRSIEPLRLLEATLRARAVPFY